jgi:hypothetical protein
MILGRSVKSTIGTLITKSVEKSVEDSVWDSVWVSLRSPLTRSVYFPVRNSIKRYEAR